MLASRQCLLHIIVLLRDVFHIGLVRNRPFNLKGGGYCFLFRSEFFFRTTRELEYLFCCCAKREIFFQNSTLGYMTKTLNQIIFFFLHQNQIIFFFLHQNQNIFFSNIGNQNIFLEKKKHNPPPLQVIWSFPYRSEACCIGLRRRPIRKTSRNDTFSLQLSKCLADFDLQTVDKSIRTLPVFSIYFILIYNFFFFLKSHSCPILIIF